MKKELFVLITLATILPMANANCFLFQQIDVNGTAHFVIDANGIINLCNYSDLNIVQIDYNRLQADYNAIMQDTNQVQGQLNSCNTNNLALSTQNTDLTGQISTIQGEKSTIQGNLTEATANLNACNNQKSLLEGDYNNNITQLKTMCASAKTTTEATLQALIGMQATDQNKTATIQQWFEATSGKIGETTIGIGLVLIVAVGYIAAKRMPKRRKPNAEGNANNALLGSERKETTAQ